MSRSTASQTSSRSLRAADTRRRILQSATRIFLEEGYSQSSLERVAESAGVTKPTIYNHFRSKQGLFDAVIEHNTRQRLEELSRVLQFTGDLRQDLIRIGDFFLSRVLSPRAQRWDRLAAAESMTNPHLGVAFYQAGPAQVVKRMADYLSEGQQQGLLDFPNAVRAAEQLIGMFLCLDLLRLQIGYTPPSPSRRKQRCREAVDAFLKAYGVNS
jgi:TetR/AcrR family transcriptional repressor of mexJK operon